MSALSFNYLSLSALVGCEILVHWSYNGVDEVLLLFLHAVLVEFLVLV